MLPQRKPARSLPRIRQRQVARPSTTRLPTAPGPRPKRTASHSRIEVDIADRQRSLVLDEPRLLQAVRNVLAAEGIRSAQVSLAVVDDPTMHELNRQYLNHDYPTDVLSFVLERSEHALEGEIIVSADTAIGQAQRYGWSPASELLLYVVHGALHLAGHDDASPADRRRMQEQERIHLASFGLKVPYRASAARTGKSQPKKGRRPKGTRA